MLIDPSPQQLWEANWVELEDIFARQCEGGEEATRRCSHSAVSKLQDGLGYGGQHSETESTRQWPWYWR